MSKIQVFIFDSFPNRTLTMAYSKPGHDLSLKKDHVLSQGLIAINASLIVDPFIVQVAANKCIVNETNGSMKTKSLAAELLYTLSPSLHVTESLKTFGLSPGMTFVLFAAFDMNLEDFKNRLSTMVTESELLDLSAVPENCDMDRIVKTYKVVDLEDAINEISSSIAVKGI